MYIFTIGWKCMMLTLWIWKFIYFNKIVKQRNIQTFLWKHASKVHSYCFSMIQVNYLIIIFFQRLNKRSLLLVNNLRPFQHKLKKNCWTLKWGDCTHLEKGNVLFICTVFSLYFRPLNSMSYVLGNIRHCWWNR